MIVFDGPLKMGHTYATEGIYEICVAAYNFVSHDTECWNVSVMNPVPEGKYNIQFDPVAIGCGCGAEPYLGNGNGESNKAKMEQDPVSFKCQINDLIVL